MVRRDLIFTTDRIILATVVVDVIAASAAVEINTI